MSVEQEQRDEEERILKLIQEQVKNEKISEEQESFNKLAIGVKLKKLQELVKKSQVFSSIIADTLLESSLKATTAVEDVSHLMETPPNDDKENENPKSDEDAQQLPPKKKRRGGVGSKKKIKNEFQTQELSEKSVETKVKLEKAATGNNIETNKQPALITGCKMKDYQLAGMEWLVTLYQNGLNGILADEMGLGKTLQSIALLAFLQEHGIKGPFLICCPLSTVSNWVNEFNRFAPDMNVLGYVGLKDDREKMRNRGELRSNSVIVTSYEISIRDFKYLYDINWRFLIVDEGHRLKNNDCLLIKQLKRFRTSNRLLLTGTPLQNNLDELWSLLNFILPDIFHDIDMFQQWFDFSALENLKSDGDDQMNEIINSEIQKSLVSNLHTILKPFLLRRLKKNVIKGLPPKREYIIYGKLTPKQELLYKATINKTLKEVLLKESFKEYISVNDFRDLRRTLKDSELIDEFIEKQLTESLIIEEDDDDVDDNDGLQYKDREKKNIFQKLQFYWDIVAKEVRQKKLQNSMMQLRLLCDSPYLFFYPWEENKSKSDNRDAIIENSCKLQILNQLIPRLYKEGHKVLIFSQFTSMLDLLEDFVTLELGLKVKRIDGSTDQLDRKNQIQDFNNGEADVFLLSTRAGGLGINLTSADSVILFDSDWNPQVDLQAMDRVHRIGQTKPVIIYRLAVSNTIEEVILAKADSKRRLEKLVIELGKFENLVKSLANTTSNSIGSSDILSELGKLLIIKDFKIRGGELKDSQLSDEELDELLNRDMEYYNQDREIDSKFRHIQLFESLNPLE